MSAHEISRGDLPTTKQGGGGGNHYTNLFLIVLCGEVILEYGKCTERDGGLYLNFNSDLQQQRKLLRSEIFKAVIMKNAVF
jgi:hypothetical protein